MIDLYTWATPNGRKISIALEEMDLPYTVHPINLVEDEQFNPDFLKISPNNKIPAIYDTETETSVFESGAILIYLAEKTGKFLSSETPQRARTLEWLFWQTSGFGPMLGQLNFFINRSEEKIPGAIARFLEEAIRLFDVLDHQLSNCSFVSGEYSIADMAIYPWSEPALVTLQQRANRTFNNVAAWHARMEARSTVQAGMNIPVSAS